VFLSIVEAAIATGHFDRHSGTLQNTVWADNITCGSDTLITIDSVRYSSANGTQCTNTNCLNLSLDTYNGKLTPCKNHLKLSRFCHQESNCTRDTLSALNITAPPRCFTGEFDSPVKITVEYRCMQMGECDW